MEQQTPMKTRWDKLGPRVVEALKKRNFAAWYCSSAQEAVEQVFQLIPQTDVMSWGGSMTVEALGLQAEARRRGYTLQDRDKAQSPEERREMMRQALLCDTFLMSSNAISENGVLVNLDGTGNRVAAMAYGPKQVIVLAGMNKVVKTEADAIQRCRTVAAPANLQRFPGLKTPCQETGACGDCISPDCICNYLLVTRGSAPAEKIKVILIGEDLGL